MSIRDRIRAMQARKAEAMGMTLEQFDEHVAREQQRLDRERAGYEWLHATTRDERSAALGRGIATRTNNTFTVLAGADHA